MVYSEYMAHRSFSSPSRGQTRFWAAASLITLPFSLIIFASIGLTALTAFALGVFATMLVLTLNLFIEGSLWISREQWQEMFENPEASMRLAIVAGALLLIVESAAIFYIVASPGADELLLKLIEQRQCANPQGAFIDVCRVLAGQP